MGMSNEEDWPPLEERIKAMRESGLFKDIKEILKSYSDKTTKLSEAFSKYVSK